MSQENVEIIGSFYEAINRLDLDDALQYLHPEGEIHPALGGVMDIGRRYHGRDGQTRLLRTITEGLEGVETSIGGGETFLAGAIRVEPQEMVEVGGDRILRVERWRIGAAQGIETEVELTHLYAFRDGLIARVDGFRDRAEALEAAGLRE